MKKTLIALSVLVAAGSVNAATVYENDGVAVTVYGDSQVSYTQAMGSDNDAQFAIGDADFGFTASNAIDDNYTVFTKIEFDGEDATESTHSVNLDDLYIGVKGNGLTVQVGKQVTYVDDLGISNDFNFGLSTAEDAAGLIASGDQVVKVQYDADAFSVGMTTATQSDGDDTTEEASQIALYAGFSAGSVAIDAYYADESGATSATDGSVFGVEATFGMDNVSVTAIYTSAEMGNTDYDAMGANINYSMDKTAFNFGAVTLEAGSADDVLTWYGNVNYAIATNATVYVELSDSDADNVDMGYAVGAVMSF
jgi:hypothetical protein